VAVTGTMLITTILVSAVMLLLWKWPPVLAVPVLIGFLLVDGLFFAANVPKIVQGGAFPVLAGIVLFVLMTTWKRGKELLVDASTKAAAAADLYQQHPRAAAASRAGHCGVPHRAARCGAHALLHNLLHNQVLHEQVVLLTVVYEDIPRVPPHDGSRWIPTAKASSG
jgi:KUP system potassium uptake protein